MCLNFISKNFTSINISQLADANSICDILEIIKSQIRSDTRWRYQSDKQILHEVEDALSSVSRKSTLPAPEESQSPMDPGSPPDILTLKRHTHTPPSSPSPPIPKKYKMRTRSGEKRKTGTKISQYRAYSVVDINNRRHSVQRKTTLLNISVPTNSTVNGNSYEKVDAFSDGDTKNMRNTIKYPTAPEYTTPDILSKLDRLQEMGERINSRKSLVPLAYSSDIIPKPLDLQRKSLHISTNSLSEKPNIYDSYRMRKSSSEDSLTRSVSKYKN